MRLDSIKELLTGLGNKMTTSEFSSFASSLKIKENGTVDSKGDIINMVPLPIIWCLDFCNALLLRE